MRLLAIFISILVSVFAQSEILEVTAKEFIANEKKHTIELIDNVKITKGKDELFANKVIIDIDDKRTPISYSAYGDVKFTISTKDNRTFFGTSKEAFYNVESGEYRLVGNGELKEKNNINTIIGDEIIVNNDVGYVNITGTNNKPAKLIFKLDEKKKK